jgi:anti-sigma regulatory factor (Ser/Thr protein kinase)
VERGSAVAGESRRVDAWATAVLGEASTIEGVHRVGLALVEGGGRGLLFTSDDRVQDGRPDWCHIDSYDDVPLTATTRRGRLVAGMLDDLEPRYGDFARAKKAAGSVAIASIPLTAGGRVVGGCILYFATPQRFDARHCRQLVELGTVLGARLALSRRPVRREPPHLSTAHGFSATYEVPAELAGVPDARAFLRRTLSDWGLEDDVVDSATLCLSEIVTNALIHTDGGCHVQVTVQDGVLGIRVHDLGQSDAQQNPPAQDDLEIRGRGLQIVEALSARSGRDEAAAVSWFEVDL